MDETRRRVYRLLQRIPGEGLPAVKDLFCTELNYRRADLPLSWRGWPDGAKETLTEPPTLLAHNQSRFGDFDIVHATLSPERQGRVFPLSVTAERLVINQLLKDHPYALFVFSDVEEQHWHLVNVRYDEEESRRRIFRRISLGPQERVRTASERVAMLDLDSFERDLFGIAPLAVQQRHDEAFDVEAVTKKFFTDYRRIFEETEEQVEGLEGKDLRQQITVLETAFSQPGPLPMVRSELNRIRQEGITGEALVELLLNIYRLHGLQRAPRQEADAPEENDALPRIVCSEALVGG